MRLGIGIDTGGTYTDAVMYDFTRKEIVCATKALTTKEDLSLGIGNALDGLPPDLVAKAELISLSTTLATNACVENKGGRARLLFIGVDRQVVDWVGGEYGLPNAEEIFFLRGKTDLSGGIVEEPDWATLLANGERWIKGAHAVGIVDIDAMDNNAQLEEKAKQLVVGNFRIPAVCSNELFSDLNSIKRGSSILLNARLIPLINDFIRATKAALTRRGISAPVVIVRSDGSLMSENFALERPVETLLCGPAASALGGIALSSESNSLIIDMGGTTTDIAIVKDGIPVKAKDGITIGKWSTFVKGLFVDTFGLGGDSAVRFDHNGKMAVQPARLLPLSVGAHRWPSITEKLRRLVVARKKHPLLVHEFFCLVRDISNNASYSREEVAFCEALKGGPLILSEAAAALGTDIYNLDATRLEEEGIVIRCGLTPTDIMHITGDFNRFNTEAARLGAEFVASCIDVSLAELCRMVYETMKKTLYANVVRVLIEDTYPSLKKGGIGKALETIIADSWEAAKSGVKDGLLQFGLHTPATLVGVGAPIHIFLPDVAKALNTRYVIPKNAGVANALGAILGNVTATCEIEIKPQYQVEGISGYIVFGKSHNSHITGMDEAIEAGLREAKTAAREEAVRRGAAGDITLTTKVVKSAAEAANKMEVLFGIKAIATAIGRVGFSEGE